MSEISEVVTEGKRRLDMYRRVRRDRSDDLLLALGKIVAKNKESNDLSYDFKAVVAHIVRDIEIERNGTQPFDEITFPTEDSVEIVRCVHEGCCPICGRHAFITGLERVKVEHVLPVRVVDGYPEFYDYLPEWDDRMETTVECGAGHQAVASPTMHDWSGWIQRRHFAGFDYLFHTESKNDSN